MGEESFASPDHMNDEQLKQKQLWWAEQIEEVEKEMRKRADDDNAEASSQDSEKTTPAEDKGSSSEHKDS